MSFLDWSLYNNDLRSWIMGAGVTAFVYCSLVIIRRMLLKQMEKLSGRTRTPADDIIFEVMKHTRRTFLLFVAAYMGSRALVLAPPVAWGVRVAGVVVLTVQAALWGNALISALVTRRVNRTIEDDRTAITTVSLIGFIARLAFWCVLLLLALDNLGVNITALVTGLGIGGVAIALAVQNILGDLLASLSIALDKPFVPGDFIVIENLSGTVEHVGIKTTRVRALSGEQLVFANNDIIKSRLRNFATLQERRATFSFGIVYQTDAATVEAIPPMIRQIIEAQPSTRFDRCHFARYGASSLDFEAVYYVLAPEYGTYMDIQQAVNLEMFRRFEAKGIEFAYPTQTVQLVRS